MDLPPGYFNRTPTFDMPNARPYTSTLYEYGEWNSSINVSVANQLIVNEEREETRMTMNIFNFELNSNGEIEPQKVKKSPIVSVDSLFLKSLATLPVSGYRYVKSSFSYGGIHPFKSDNIDLRVLPRVSKTSKHCQITKMLTAILKSSCKTESDILQVGWSIDGKRKMPFVLPIKLRNDLQDLFAEYYLIDDSGLDDKHYCPAKHGTLRCITESRGNEKPEDAFKMYSAARHAFFSGLFRNILRRTLSELRSSTYVAADDSRGIPARFLPRKHKRMASSAESSASANTPNI